MSSDKARNRGDIGKTIPSGESTEQILLFTWPLVEGSAHDLWFHAALFHPGTYELMSYDSAIWGYY